MTFLNQTCLLRHRLPTATWNANSDGASTDEG